MNKILIGSLIALVVIGGLFQMSNLRKNDNSAELFDQWKATNNKSYNDEEYSYRLNVFKKNLKEAERLNKFNKEATFGVIIFADLTFAEFQEKYLGYDNSKKTTSNNIYTKKGDVPTDWDWTEKGAVTDVKNQGQCGSCWAFSTTGNLEGQNFIKNGSLVSLSEQQLVDCDTTCNGCNGGLMDYAFEWLEENGGIESEADYPYKGVDGQCQFDSSKVVVQVSGYEDINKGDEDALKDAVYNKGPMAIGIHAGTGLQLYISGIYSPVFCSKALNHGVLAVGYGTDTSKGKDFWKVKNSWGSSWGEKGYFRIIRGKDMCGLADSASCATVM